MDILTALYGLSDLMWVGTMVDEPVCYEVDEHVDPFVLRKLA